MVDALGVLPVAALAFFALIIVAAWIVFPLMVIFRLNRIAETLTVIKDYIGSIPVPADDKEPKV